MRLEPTHKPTWAAVRLMLLAAVPFFCAIFNAAVVGWMLKTQPAQAPAMQYILALVAVSGWTVMPFLSGVIASMAGRRVRLDIGIHPNSPMPRSAAIFSNLQTVPPIWFVPSLMFFRSNGLTEPLYKSLRELWQALDVPPIFYDAWMIYIWTALGGLLYTLNNARQDSTNPAPMLVERRPGPLAPRKKRSVRPTLQVLWLVVSMLGWQFFLYTGEWQRWPFWFWLLSFGGALYSLLKTGKPKP